MYRRFLKKTLNIDKRVDAIARYEYDYTLLDLAKTLETQGNLRSVSGLSFREGNNIIHNPGRSYIENLDELPFVSKVYKKFLKIENYFNPNALYPMVTITTSRGMPVSMHLLRIPADPDGARISVGSVGNVVAEMEYIRENFPQKAIFFEDDTMTVNKNRCKELAERILQKSVKFRGLPMPGWVWITRRCGL